MKRHEQRRGTGAKVKVRAIARHQHWQAHRQRLCGRQVEALASGWQHQRLSAAVQRQHTRIVQRSFINHNLGGMSSTRPKCGQLSPHMVVRIGECFDVQLDRISGRILLKKSDQQRIHALAFKGRRHMQKTKRFAVCGLDVLNRFDVRPDQVINANGNDKHRQPATRIAQHPFHKRRGHQYRIKMRVQLLHGVSRNRRFFPKKQDQAMACRFCIDHQGVMMNDGHRQCRAWA